MLHPVKPKLMSQIDRLALVPKDEIWFRHPEMRRRLDAAESELGGGRAEQTRTLDEAKRLLDRLKKRGT